MTARLKNAERFQAVSAMDVIYPPETERRSHYIEARLPEQFDAMIHLNTTRALEPLERSGEWEGGKTARDLSLRSLTGALCVPSSQSSGCVLILRRYRIDQEAKDFSPND